MSAIDTFTLYFGFLLGAIGGSCIIASALSEGLSKIAAAIRTGGAGDAGRDGGTLQRQEEKR